MIKLNGVPIVPTMFPDGTSQVWRLPPYLRTEVLAQVEWTFENEGEFMHLAQLKHLLDNDGAVAWLHLPYLPYGRQDKPVSNHATFALSAFAALLNSLNFQDIKITDPHSDVAMRLINRSFGVYPHDKVQDVFRKCESDVMCFPDEGALDKYSLAYMGIGPYIHGEKVRDQATGNILSYKLVGLCDLTNKNVLIVDDICDGGMTFKLLAKDLIAAGAKEVNLFVTHGIFSKGLQTLHDSGINMIFTAKGEQKESV